MKFNKTKRAFNKFKELKCSPKQKTVKISNKTCYSDKNLEEFKNIWNSNSKDKITTNVPKDIWKFFKKKLNKKCYDELCWLNQKELKNVNNKDVLIKQIFKPFAPELWKKNPRTWLSSVDITNIMEQYEKKYKHFSFIGPSPIDFDSKKLISTCVYEKLCNFNLKYYLKQTPKKRKIGIIFNLDPHYKSGSHWVCLFIDVDLKYIFYFDSNGTRIPKQIKKLVDRVITQGKENNIDFIYDSNYDFVHQMKDGQCGMYVLFVIIELMLEKISYKFFKNSRISDEKMEKYRKIYFNDYNKNYNEN